MYELFLLLKREREREFRKARAGWLNSNNGIVWLLSDNRNEKPKKRMSNTDREKVRKQPNHKEARGTVRMFQFLPQFSDIITVIIQLRVVGRRCSFSSRTLFNIIIWLSWILLFFLSGNRALDRMYAASNQRNVVRLFRYDLHHHHTKDVDCQQLIICCMCVCFFFLSHSSLPHSSWPPVCLDNGKYFVRIQSFRIGSSAIREICMVFSLSQAMKAAEKLAESDGKTNNHILWSL